MHRAGSDQHAALDGQVVSSGQGGAHLDVVLVLVGDPVLAADEHAGGPGVAAGHGQEEVGGAGDELGPLAHDVVEAQVQFVEGQLLLSLRRRLACKGG